MVRTPATEPQRTGPATLAILPVKRFGIAKVRLGDELSGGTRRALAEAMVTDVLMALRRTSRVSEVVLVTSEPAAEAIGRGYGANVLVDDREDGQSAATLIGIAYALEAGIPRVLLVPGDTPALDPAELDALLDRPATGRSVVVVPDRHGTGTNALLLTPPDVIEPAFGPDSRGEARAGRGRCGRAVHGRGGRDAVARRRHRGGPRGAAHGARQPPRRRGAHARDAQPARIDAQEAGPAAPHAAGGVIAAAATPSLARRPAAPA